MTMLSHKSDLIAALAIWRVEERVDVLEKAQRYEECRACIEAIRQWDGSTHGEGR